MDHPLPLTFFDFGTLGQRLQDARSRHKAKPALVWKPPVKQEKPKPVPPTEPELKARREARKDWLQGKLRIWLVSTIVLGVLVQVVALGYGLWALVRWFFSF